MWRIYAWIKGMAFCYLRWEIATIITFAAMEMPSNSVVVTFISIHWKGSVIDLNMLVVSLPKRCFSSTNTHKYVYQYECKNVLSILNYFDNNILYTRKCSMHINVYFKKIGTHLSIFLDPTNESRCSMQVRIYEDLKLFLLSFKLVD